MVLTPRFRDLRTVDTFDFVVETELATVDIVPVLGVGRTDQVHHIRRSLAAQDMVILYVYLTN